MISQEDKDLIRNLIDAKNHARKVSAQLVTDTYNRILNKNARVTGCAGCLRARICDLERWLNQYEIDERNQKKEEPKEEELVEVKKLEDVVIVEDKPKKKKGRPKKNANK